MYKSVTLTRTLPLPAARVWAAIAGIDGLERWFPVIDACRVIGVGVGAIRVLTLAAGGEIRDRIELIDHERRRFQYDRIESPFPVNRYLGTVTISVANDCDSVLCWTVEIDVTESHAQDLMAFLRQALTDGVVGLEKDLLATGARGAL